MANSLQTTIRNYNGQFTTTIPSQLVKAKQGDHGDLAEWYILPTGDLAIRIIKNPKNK